MESFEEKKPAYTYENPCPVCGFPVDVKIHNPEECPNAIEAIEEEKQEEEKETKGIEKFEEFAEGLGIRYEIPEEEEKVDLWAEEGNKMYVEHIKKQGKKKMEKREDLLQKFQEIIKTINVEIEDVINMAAGGKEAKRIAGQYERWWVGQHFKTFFKQKMEENGIRIPGEQWKILQRIKIPPSAKDLFEKFKKEWLESRKQQGIL